MPGTTNGSYMRDFGLNGLNAAINNYNATQGNQPTPAGQVLMRHGLMTVAQLHAIGAVAAVVSNTVPNQLTMPWVKQPTPESVGSTLSTSGTPLSRTWAPITY
jgi:hypothetical protein